jgi:hypothetical protein
VGVILVGRSCPGRRLLVRGRRRPGPAAASEEGLSLAVLAMASTHQQSSSWGRPVQIFCTGQSMSNRKKIEVRKRRWGLLPWRSRSTRKLWRRSSTVLSLERCSSTAGPGGDVSAAGGTGGRRGLGGWGPIIRRRGSWVGGERRRDWCGRR